MNDDDERMKEAKILGVKLLGVGNHWFLAKMEDEKRFNCHTSKTLNEWVDFIPEKMEGEEKKRKEGKK